MSESLRARITFGPELPEFGSWNWLGADLARGLANDFSVTIFREEIPAVEVAVFIKFLPPEVELRAIAERSAILYCPVDFYGAAAEIDADAGRLVLCRRIVAHSRRLVRYFSSYALTAYLDHHVKYVTPTRTEPLESGPLLWVGVRSNLGPLVSWVNARELPAELIVLTNVEHEADLHDPTRLGFQTGAGVRVERWSPEAHTDWITRCRAALDIKGDDFRARHKPPAKALDFLASGVPLAMNADSSSAEHLREMGFDLAEATDVEHWLSREYAEETARFGRTISDLLSLPRISARWRWLLWDVLTAAGHGTNA